MRRANWKRERAGRVVRTGMDAGKTGRHKGEPVGAAQAELELEFSRSNEF